MKSNKLLSGLIFSGIIVFNIGLFAEESIDLDQLKKKLVKAVLAGELTGEKAAYIEMKLVLSTNYQLIQPTVIRSI